MIPLIASSDIDEFQSSPYNAADTVVDTGSGLIVMYLRNTTVSQNCKDFYKLNRDLAIDQRLLSPVLPNDPVCSSFTIASPDPTDDNCTFRVSYGGGSTSLSGFISQESFAMEDSVVVLGSSNVTLSPNSTMNGELGALLNIAAIENATNCEQ